MRAYSFTSMSSIHVGATGHTHTRAECKDKDYLASKDHGQDKLPFYVDCADCAMYLLTQRNWVANARGVPKTHDERLEEEQLVKEGDVLTQQMARAFAEAAAQDVARARSKA